LSHHLFDAQLTRLQVEHAFADNVIELRHWAGHAFAPEKQSVDLPRNAGAMLRGAHGLLEGAAMRGLTAVPSPIDMPRTAFSRQRPSPDPASTKYRLAFFSLRCTIASGQWTIVISRISAARPRKDS
jgi:hypothetical protein